MPCMPCMSSLAARRREKPPDHGLDLSAPRHLAVPRREVLDRVAHDDGHAQRHGRRLRLHRRRRKPSADRRSAGEPRPEPPVAFVGAEQGGLRLAAVSAVAGAEGLAPGMTLADARASFSNRGPCVDLFAPGQDITSARRGGGETTFSGTSMSNFRLMRKRPTFPRR